MEAETKYIRSMILLNAIKRGKGIDAERKNSRLLDNLVMKGFILHRPRRRN